MDSVSVDATIASQIALPAPSMSSTRRKMVRGALSRLRDTISPDVTVAELETVLREEVEKTLKLPRNRAYNACTLPVKEIRL